MLLQVFAAQWLVAMLVGQVQAYLAKKRMQGGIQRVAYIEILTFVTKVYRPKPHGKQNAGQLRDHRLDGRGRREVAPTRLQGTPLGYPPLLTDIGQLGDDGLDVEYCHVWNTCKNSGK